MKINWDAAIVSVVDTIELTVIVYIEDKSLTPIHFIRF